MTNEIHEQFPFLEPPEPKPEHWRDVLKDIEELLTLHATGHMFVYSEKLRPLLPRIKAVLDKEHEAVSDALENRKLEDQMLDYFCNKYPREFMAELDRLIPKKNE